MTRKRRRGLHRLEPDGRHLVSDSFLRGDAEIPEDAIVKYVVALEHDGQVDLSSLDDKVGAVVSEHSRYDTSMDGAIATDVHRYLDLDRRTAAVPGLWHWLAIERYPEFVRHRWEYRSEEAMREKFLGAGSDLYSNAIHRLWWIAELTHEGADYSLTEAVFSNQTMVNKVFDRWFARYRPAVIPLCRTLSEEPSWVIDDVTRRFNRALTNVQLEGLSKTEARDIVERITREVKDGD